VNPQGASPIQRLLKFASDIYPEEVRASLYAFLLVMVLMAAYYIMRPVRDSMASDWSDAEVSWVSVWTWAGDSRR
jgi:AAA family ATP:ADP antiporter